MLPELDPGVGVAAELGDPRKRDAVGGRRQHRAGREVDAQPDDIRGVDAALGEQPGHGRADRRHVVVRILERPVGLEKNVVVRGRQAAIDDAVGVLVDRGGQLRAGREIDQHGPSRLGPEVEPDGVRHRRSSADGGWP
jgi:hypothetical protein